MDIEINKCPYFKDLLVFIKVVDKDGRTAYSSCELKSVDRVVADLKKRLTAGKPQED